MPLFSPIVDTNYCHYNIFYNCEISFSHTCTNQTSLIINGLMKYLKKKFKQFCPFSVISIGVSKH